MKLKNMIWLLLFFAIPIQPYDFKGIHYIASFKKCDRERLNDVAYLLVALIGAIDASGATILSYHVEKFEGGGVTASFLLSESHASIHTYPEHGSCFIDLFTCGDTCHWEPFDKILAAYLEPADKHTSVIERN